MSSVVNKSKNKFAPKAKARVRGNVASATPALEPTATPAAQKPVVPAPPPPPPPPAIEPEPSYASRHVAIPTFEGATHGIGIPVLEGAGEVQVSSVRPSAPPTLVNGTEAPVRPPPSIARAIPQLEGATETPAITVDKSKGDKVAVNKGKGKAVVSEKGHGAAGEPPMEAEQSVEPVEEAITQTGGAAASKKTRTRKAPAPRKRKAPLPPPPSTEVPLEGVRRSSRAKKPRIQEADTQNNADEGQEDDEIMADAEEEEEAFREEDGEEDEEEYEGEKRPQKKANAKSKAKPKSQDKGKPKAPRKPRAPRKPKEPGDGPQRRGRRRQKTPDDAEDQKIEEDVVKMKDLCKDPRIGRKSKRGKELENAEFNEAVRRRMASKTELAERRARGEDVDEAEEDRLERLASANRINRPGAAPQMRVVNGQMVLDEESLRVNRHERDALAVEDMEIVEENVHTRLVNSATWSKRVRGDRWDEDSTDRFYQALSMFGTDFEMISRLFPGRARREVKNKFNCEERKDPARVTQALKTRVVVNMAEYSQITNQQFPDPGVLEKELQQLRDEHEAEAETSGTLPNPGVG
ncbi:hypothetical protein FN846DRAFT_606818 [Sphaerosporella brunnea]|uniref:Myb-like domain-containing protein n=1 Tax=Sphaerosporella brunnea TaxID=1250544 RepID=A0A5J5F1C9_9PEZI|nr:hypothetical protein FN846DRAFT_606818 [Sphaerosporella brunnea]